MITKKEIEAYEAMDLRGLCYEYHDQHTTMSQNLLKIDAKDEDGTGIRYGLNSRKKQSMAVLSLSDVYLLDLWYSAKYKCDALKPMIFKLMSAMGIDAELSLSFEDGKKVWVSLNKKDITIPK
jgi:hypothetical protein